MTSDPEVALVINGKPIPLAPFVQALIGRAVLGMVVNLKGVDAPQHVQLDIRTPPGK